MKKMIAYGCLLTTCPLQVDNPILKDIVRDDLHAGMNMMEIDKGVLPTILEEKNATNGMNLP